MPLLTASTPKYRKHKASGQAIVQIQGRAHYLGPYGTKASKVEYYRLIGEWLAAGRPAAVVAPQNEITVVEVAAACGSERHKHSARRTKFFSVESGVKQAAWQSPDSPEDLLAGCRRSRRRANFAFRVGQTVLVGLDGCLERVVIPLMLEDLSAADVGAYEQMFFEVRSRLPGQGSILEETTSRSSSRYTSC